MEQNMIYLLIEQTNTIVDNLNVVIGTQFDGEFENYRLITKIS